MDFCGIDLSAPVIWADDWPLHHASGWRWERNLCLDCRDFNLLNIRALQREHGKTNVAIGHPWGQFGPFLSGSLIGIYVRDIEKLVKDLYDWMNDWHDDKSRSDLL